MTIVERHIHACGVCGRRYSVRQWEQLELRGVKDALEHRQCPCHNTLTREEAEVQTTREEDSRRRMYGAQTASQLGTGFVVEFEDGLVIPALRAIGRAIALDRCDLATVTCVLDGEGVEPCTVLVRGLDVFPRLPDAEVERLVRCAVEIAAAANGQRRLACNS